MDKKWLAEVLCSFGMFTAGIENVHALQLIIIASIKWTLLITLKPTKKCVLHSNLLDTTD